MTDKRSTPKPIDLTGEHIGHLIVLYETVPILYNCGKIHRRWVCECVCGNTTTVNQCKLRSQSIKSCGCMKNSLISESRVRRYPCPDKMYGQYLDMYRRAKSREDCEVEFTNLEDFVKYAYANGWYEGCSVCRNGDVGNYAKGNIRFDTQASNVIEAFAGHFTLVSPEGDIVEVYNMSQFCRDNNLTQSLMSKVCVGDRKHHKKWRLYVRE